MKKEVNNEEKKNKKSKTKKALKWIAFFLIFQIIYVPILSIVLIYYGPFTNTRDMIVTTAMTTMRHQYFATLFLSKEKIDEILAKNRPQENIEDQSLSAINVGSGISAEDMNGIELKDVSNDSYTGKLLIINDPSRVKLVSSPRLGTSGATTSQIVAENDAVAGMNAGGFQDDALGTGGKPAGLVIEDGQLRTTNTGASYSLVGMDKDNKMVVSNSMTYSKCQQLNLRCAVSFGPVIIINGNATIKSGTGGWGMQPRTAIAQRKDGAILMLVIDGRQKGSLGATLRQVQDILLDNGAYNAFNLDGGASTTMVYNGNVVNSPSDILGERYVPNAFIVTKPNKK
ncbi:MAG: phosphodiester glycosidase family protein [Christensenellales bacterium]